MKARKKREYKRDKAGKFTFATETARTPGNFAKSPGFKRTKKKISSNKILANARKKRKR